MRYVVLVLLAMGCSKKTPPAPVASTSASASASVSAAPSTSSSVIGAGPIEFQAVPPPTDFGGNNAFQHAHYGWSFRSSVPVTLTFELVDRVHADDESPPAKRIFTRTVDLEAGKARTVFLQLAWPVKAEAGTTVPRVSYSVDAEAASVLDFPPFARSAPGWNVNTFGVSGPKRFEPDKWSRLVVTIPTPVGQTSNYKLAPEIVIETKEGWTPADKFREPVLTFRVRASKR